jgi:ATP/maltotriose-dependent transcriptional regulator MalT
VLGRFTPELCDAVLDRDDSAAVLAELERTFLVALDGRERWYRYHHLFGELLQLELGLTDSSKTRSSTPPPGGDAESVAELLVENHLELIRSGQLAEFLGWVRSLPAEVLLQHDSLPEPARWLRRCSRGPEIEVQRLLAVAQRARGERPGLWPSYVEALVEVTRSILIERRDVGAAVEHGRRAVAAAREGAEVLSVGVLAALAQGLFFAGDLEETRRIAMQAVERPDASDFPDGNVGCLGVLALLDAEQGRPESAEAWARQAISFPRKRFQADLFTTSLAHVGLALACATTGRLDEAEREALRGERLRRSPQPTVGHAHALLVLAQVRVARARLERAAGDLDHARRLIADFPIRAATGDRDQGRAGPRHGPSGCRKRSPRRATQRGRVGRAAVPRSQPFAARDRRAAVHLGEHRQDPHTRAVPQAGRNIASRRGRARGSAGSARAD